MLSDEVKVSTRHYKSTQRYLIELEKGNEWTSINKTDDVSFDGTEVILNYTNFFGVFKNDFKNVKKFLMTYFLTDGIEFELIDKSAKIIEKIDNPIKLTTPLEKGFVKIDFQDYLNDIEGYALIKSKSEFIKKFADIKFHGTLYKYNEEEGLVEVEDISSLNIDDYINEKQIKYLSIPIVEYDIEDDFQNGMKFTDGDIDEVIDKLDDKLTWISVIVPKNLQDYLSADTLDSKAHIFDNLGFNELVKIGHSASCETKSKVKTITLFEGRKNELYLPFKNTDNDYKPYWARTSDGRKDLFIRGVLIREFDINAPISASIFETNIIIANIKSRRFIPDISRNDVELTEKKLINYMIGKAIHIGASKLLTLDADEKATLQKFILSFYDQKTDYEK